jgi:outer membrane protein
MTFVGFRPLTWFVAALALVLCAPANAQQKPAETASPGAVRMAVVDLARIANEGSLFKSVGQQLEEYRSSFQAMVQAEEEELRKADQELARKRAILSPEAFAAERRKFEERITELQKLGQERKQRLNAARANALL